MERSERLKNWAEFGQALVIATGLIGGAVLSYPKIAAFAESRLAVAQADEAEAAAKSAQLTVERESENRVIVNAEIAAAQLAAKPGRWVLVSVALSNTGNKAVRLDLAKNTRFYVSRVSNVGTDGVGNYDRRRNLKFDYQDKTVEWIMLRPGATLERMHAIQQVGEAGIYLARIAIQEPDKEVGEGREFSSDTYFLVK